MSLQRFGQGSIIVGMAKEHSTTAALDAELQKRFAQYKEIDTLREDVGKRRPAAA